jgi:hypothetical protein
MKGFDPKFRDFPDYILGITKEIWEDRGLHTLHDYYAKDIVVRSPGSVVTGNEGVIAATMATLHEFPDRVLLGEDVIWSGTPEDGDAVLAPHPVDWPRIWATGSLARPRAAGSPTASIADCHAKDNVIDDEWLIRDQGAIVRQTGLGAARLRRRSDRARGRRRGRHPAPDARDGPRRPLCRHRQTTDPWGGRSPTSSSGSWAPIWRDPGGIRPRLRAALPGRRHRARGRGGRPLLDGPPRGLPERRVHPPPRHRARGPDHAAARRRALEPLGPAYRLGRLRQPTGAMVYVLGITHAEFGTLGAAPPTLRREWTLYDETAIWKQILLHEAGS